MILECQKFFNDFVSLLVDGLLYVVVLGFKVDSVGEGDVCMCLFYCEDLVGDLEIGVIYGGVVMVLLDYVCGLVVFMGFGGEDVLVMLDLCIDYMCLVEFGQDIIVEVVSLCLCGLVCFVCVIVYDGNIDELVVFVQVVFMIINVFKVVQECVQWVLCEGDLV